MTVREPATWGSHCDSDSEKASGRAFTCAQAVDLKWEAHACEAQACEAYASGAVASSCASKVCNGLDSLSPCLMNPLSSCASASCAFFLQAPSSSGGGD